MLIRLVIAKDSEEAERVFIKKILFSCSFMTSITFYFRLFVLNNKLTHVGIAICVVFSLLNYSIFNCLSLTNYYIKKKAVAVIGTI